MDSGRSRNVVTGVLAAVTVVLLASPAFGGTDAMFGWGVVALALTLYVGARGDL